MKIFCKNIYLKFFFNKIHLYFYDQNEAKNVLLSENEIFNTPFSLKVINNEDEKIRSEKIGIKDLNKKYSLDELAHGDIIFSATGVTEGTMVRGVRTNQNKYVTHSLVLRTGDSSSQYIETYHDIS